MAADKTEYQIRHHLPDVDDGAIFDTVLSFLLAGFQAMAPKPCPCPRHSAH